MRVCFISRDAGLGGASRALAELVEALQALGIRCRVVVPGPGPLVAELRRLGTEITWLPCPWWVGTSVAPWERAARTAATLIMAGPFVARLASFRCDVVYTNTLTVPVGALAARAIGVPHVWHLHEFGEKGLGLRFDLGLRGAARFIDRLSAAVVAVSQAVAAEFAPLVAPGMVRVVYQAVTVRPNPEAEREAWRERREWGRAFRAVIVGDVSEAKGHADAVRAVAEVVREGIDAELVAVGGWAPGWRERVGPLAEELGLGDRVRMTGRLANPYPVVRTADVALMCSRAEAFGRVTVEAMLAGKPVVGARGGNTAAGEGWVQRAAVRAGGVAGVGGADTVLVGTPAGGATDGGGRAEVGERVVCAGALRAGGGWDPGGGGGEVAGTGALTDSQWPWWGRRLATRRSQEPELGQRPRRRAAFDAHRRRPGTVRVGAERASS